MAAPRCQDLRGADLPTRREPGRFSLSVRVKRLAQPLTAGGCGPGAEQHLWEKAWRKSVVPHDMSDDAGGENEGMVREKRLPLRQRGPMYSLSNYQGRRPSRSLRRRLAATNDIAATSGIKRGPMCVGDVTIGDEVTAFRTESNNASLGSNVFH